MRLDDQGGPEDLGETCLCDLCLHYWGEGRCAAFPQGIPLAILRNEQEHCHPLPGDHRITFTPRD